MLSKVLEGGRVCCGLVLVVITVTHGASASEVQSTDNVARSRIKSAIIEEVTVTAQKREEDSQDVPVAMATFSQEQLVAFGVDEPAKLSLVTPGLQFNELAGFSVTFLRGVGTDAYLMADPSVAMYVDEVYMPFPMAANKKFGQLERIEVLKGPQGTLFGRNAVGGAISIITKKPNPEEVEAELGLEYGSYDKRGAKAFVNLPLFANSALAMSVLEDSRDAWYDGVTSVSATNPQGKKIRGEETKGWRARLLFEPWDWASLLLGVSNIQSDGAETSYAVNRDPSPLAQALGIESQEGFDGTSRSLEPKLGGTTKVYSAKLVFNFDPFDVRLIGANQKITSYNWQDFDGSPLPLVDFKVVNNRADIDSIELQIASNDTSWGAEKWQWMFGGYWSDGISAVDPAILFVGGTLLSDNNFLGGPTPPLVQQFRDGLPAGLSSLTPSGGVYVDSALGTLSESVFFQTTYDFTNELSLTLGGRYQEETRTVLDSRSYQQNADGSKGQVIIDGRNTDLAKDPLVSKNFAPKISLEYRPTDTFLSYVSYQEAQKSATFNVFNPIDTPDKVDSEDIAAYEIGFKSEWYDGLMRLNGAVFYYDQQNLVVQYTSLMAGGAIGPENAPKSSIRGAEFDLTADLWPEVFDGLYLTLSGSYIDAKFDDFSSCTGYEEDTGLYSESIDCTGNQIPRAPKRTWRLGLNKIITFDESHVEIAASYYSNSGYYTLSTNSKASEQVAFDVVNAFIKYEYEPWNLSITAYADNVRDELYTQSIITTDFGNFVSYSQPRAYGARLSWKY